MNLLEKIFKQPKVSKSTLLIAEELDNMLLVMCTEDWKWNFQLIKPYVHMVRIICKEMNDFELYHVVMKELIVKKFWKLPNQQKWQALILMEDYLSNGNVMNEIGKKVSQKILPSQLEQMIKKCPNPKGKKRLAQFRIYFRNNK